MTKIDAICETCGKPVELWCDGDETMVLHSGCDKPVVKMPTHNPRTLGVITGETA
jgi:hypothetical protein